MHTHTYVISGDLQVIFRNFTTTSSPVISVTVRTHAHTGENCRVDSGMFPKGQSLLEPITGHLNLGHNGHNMECFGSHMAIKCTLHGVLDRLSPNGGGGLVYMKETLRI